MSKRHGTKKQRKVICEYVRWMANALELRDWTFHIMKDEPTDTECMAAIQCIYGRKHANISFRREFWSESPESQRQTVAHELIHAHLQPTIWNLNNLGSHVAVATFDVVMGGHKDAVEFAVDALADAVAKHLPVPKWDKEKKAA